MLDLVADNLNTFWVMTKGKGIPKSGRQVVEWYDANKPTELELLTLIAHLLDEISGLDKLV